MHPAHQAFEAQGCQPSPQPLGLSHDSVPCELLKTSSFPEPDREPMARGLSAQMTQFKQPDGGGLARDIKSHAHALLEFGGIFRFQIQR